MQRCAVIALEATSDLVEEDVWKASLIEASKHHKGPFESLDLISLPQAIFPDSDSGLRSSIDAALKMEPEWLLFLPVNQCLDKAAFQRVANELNHYDAVWGLTVEMEHDAQTVSLRTPQLIDLQSYEELLLFDARFTLDGAFFVRAQAAQQVLSEPSLQVSDSYSLALKLWQKHRCIKVPEVVSVDMSSVEVRGRKYQQWNQHLVSHRQQLNLHRESETVIELKNRVSLRHQELYRQLQLTQDENRFLITRCMPYRGYVDVNGYLGEPFTLFSNNDDIVVGNLLWSGKYEAMSTRLWQVFAMSAETILDIGAYTGFYGFLATRSAPQSQVICVEPLSENFARALLNAQLNNMQRVSIYKVAASDQNGFAPLSIYGSGDFLTSGASLLGEQRSQPVRQEYVQAARMDELIKQCGWPKVGLVKIDVEGAQDAVINGMSEILQRYRPDIFIEVLEDTHLEHINMVLRDLGYRFYDIDEDQRLLVEQSTLTKGTGLSNINRLATVREADDVAAKFKQAQGIAENYA